MTFIDRKTNGQFPGRKKRETNGIRPMRTEMSVVSQSDMYEGANMSKKGLRILLRNLGISVLLLASTTFVLFLLSLIFCGDLSVFQSLLERAASAFGARTIWKGFSYSPTLSFVIVVAVQAALNGLDGESIKLMAPSGSSESDSCNWKKFFKDFGEEASSSAAQNRGPLQEPAGVQGQPQPGPSSDKTSSAPAQSNSSTWSGSWIGNWLNQGQEVSSSSAPNPPQSSPQLSPDSQWNELVQSYRVGEINPPAPPAAPPAPAVIENQQAPPAQEHNQGVNIPELEQPLLPDDVRREELAGRLGVHFMGRQDHALLPALLDKQMQLETNIEAALVDAGFDPASILLRRHAIRGIIFYPQGSPLSEKALNKYMAEILRRGTQESLPFQRILRAIKKYELDLR